MDSTTLVTFCGLPDFSLALRRDENGQFILKASIGLTDYAMRHIDLFGHDGTAIDAEEALVFLTAHWPTIAGPFGDFGIEEGEVDFSGISQKSNSPIVFRRSGPYVSFDDARPQVDLDGHSVVVVECLLHLGNTLASHVDNASLLSAWSEARERTDLFPFRPDTYLEPDIERDTSGIFEEAAWHARKFGETKEEYVRTAKWLEARSALCFIDPEIKAPSYEDWFRARDTSVPDEKTVDDMVERAAALDHIHKSFDEFCADSVDARNCESRQINVYKRWYGEERRVRKNQPRTLNTMVDGAFYGQLTSFDTTKQVGELSCGGAKNAIKIIAMCSEAVNSWKVLSDNISRSPELPNMVLLQPCPFLSMS